jgi:adenylosuccinate synthase
LPSLFKEMEELTLKGYFNICSCYSGIPIQGRLFLSDRAHLVFEFHRIVDELKEKELGKGNLGTTRKGIGPAYSTKVSRSGIRVHHLFQMNEFELRFRKAVATRQLRYGSFDYPVEKELDYYKVIQSWIHGRKWQRKFSLLWWILFNSLTNDSFKAKKS